MKKNYDTDQAWPQVPDKPGLRGETLTHICIINHISLYTVSYTHIYYKFAMLFIFIYIEY